MDDVKPTRAKRPYTLRPHLVTRPLSGNTELKALRNSMSKKGSKK